MGNALLLSGPAGPQLCPLPLRSNCCCCVQCKLSHHTFFQVLLLPLCHVCFQRKNPLLLFPQELHKCCGIVLRDVGRLRGPLSLMWKSEKTRVWVGWNRTFAAAKPQEAQWEILLGHLHTSWKIKAGSQSQIWINQASAKSYFDLFRLCSLLKFSIVFNNKKEENSFNTLKWRL